jgi:hypothetical protein
MASLQVHCQQSSNLVLVMQLCSNALAVFETFSKLAQHTASIWSRSSAAALPAARLVVSRASTCTVAHVCCVPSACLTQALECCEQTEFMSRPVLH